MTTHTRLPVAPFDPRGTDWIALDELEVGDLFTGTILKLPTPGAFNGHRLFLETGGVIVGIHATAKRGHTVLERALEGFAVGDLIEVAYHGFRSTADGQRSYRHYEVRHAS